LKDFESGKPGARGETAVSIKLRVAGGCFHREHSPHAYSLIDKHLDALPPGKREFRFEEHESGPGLRMLARMPRSLKSAAQLRTNERSAALVAAYVT